MKNSFRNISLLTLIPCIPLTLGLVVFSSSCSHRHGKPDNFPHDQDSWKHAIEHISSCKHPTIFLTTDAAYNLQQAASLYLASSQLAISQNHTYKNNDFKFNDLIFCVPYSSWHYKTATPGSSEGKFALNYNYLVDESFGYVDILKQSLTTKKIDLSKGNHMLVSNLQDFNLILDNYNSSLPDYEEYFGFYISFNIVNKIIDLYEQENPNIKFNFVINDYSWDNCLTNSKNNDDIARAIVRMYRKTDKIYLISDGSWTWVEGNKKFKKYFQDYGYMSLLDQKKQWDKIVTSSDYVAINTLRENPYAFLNNENYYYNFGASTTATLAPDNLDPQNWLTEQTTYKFTTPWLSTKSYHQVLSGQNFNLFESSYLKLFKYQDGDYKFSNLFVGDTKNNFKPSKKNLIWMLPQKLAVNSGVPTQVWTTCKNILNKVLQNYPSNQWNYIVKAHPKLSASDVQHSIMKLFDKQQVPDNVCIIDPVFPFEYSVTLDWYMVQNGIESNYHLINPNTLDDDHPSGIITGFDISTTGIYAVMSMLVTEYNFQFDSVKKIVKDDCFFIPKKIRIPDYVSEQEKDYVSENIDNLKKFYLPFIQNNEFPDVTNFSIFND